MVNTDISSIAIKQMRERNADLRPEMEWVIDDCTCTKLKDGDFDLVIDKGLIDTLACQSNFNVAISSFLKETKRVMKEDGVYLCVSMSPPEQRMPYFTEQ